MALVSLAPAQSAPDPSKKILPTTHFQLSAAIERTPEQMDAFDATAAMPAEEKAEPGPRPTIDPALYAQLKQRAALAPLMAKPNSGTAPQQLAATSLKFTGATECDGPGGCWVPPDVAGSIGKGQFVSVSNNVFEVRSRTGTLLKINSLNGLMSYSTEALFDPRVQYDEEYQRFIITADAFAESTTVQYFFIAISQTNSATGNWFIYKMNTNGFTGTGSFYDFPMLGISQDAVMVTANVFGTSSFLGSYMFSIAKARLYGGQGFSVPVFTGLIATLAPPHQLLSDQNAYAWFASAPSGSGNIYMYALLHGSNAFQASLSGPYTVTGVPAYTVPPGAKQPTACAPAGALLDTLDNRFQNIGIQAGDTYYQVHTVTVALSFAAPRYYIITGLNSFAPAVSVANTFYASGSSYDWNPSIAADPNGHFGLNWSSTDTTVNASMRFTDNKSGNPANVTGINVFTSASCYTGAGTSRWGDYSQTSVDYGSGTAANGNLKIFWIDNETIPSASFWSTEIAKMAY